MINTIPEKEHNVYIRLSREDEIIELKPLFESKRYDMIATIKKESLEELESFIRNKIKEHDGVIKTTTYY